MFPLTISPDRLSFIHGVQSWIWRGTLDWMLYGRHLSEGEAVSRRIIQDRRSVGANTVCCAGNLFSWHPALRPDNPQSWSELRPFVDMAAEEDMRVCFVVFCTTTQLMPGMGSQLAHWERFVTTLGDKINVTLVLVNQPGYPDQRDFDSLAFSKIQVGTFPQLLCARGNPGEQENPRMPAWDFSCYCSSRDELKYAETGSSMHYIVDGWGPGQSWQGTRQVSILFEPPHAHEIGTWSDPSVWRQLGRSLCFKGTGGGNFYSDQCAQAQLLIGRQRACAIEFLGNIPPV
jgi:hypothetical protein